MSAIACVCVYVYMVMLASMHVALGHWVRMLLIGKLSWSQGLRRRWGILNAPLSNYVTSSLIILPLLQNGTPYKDINEKRAYPKAFLLAKDTSLIWTLSAVPLQWFRFQNMVAERGPGFAEFDVTNITACYVPAFSLSVSYTVGTISRTCRHVIYDIWRIATAGG